MVKNSLKKKKKYEGKIKMYMSEWGWGVVAQGLARRRAADEASQVHFLTRQIPYRVEGRGLEAEGTININEKVRRFSVGSRKE